MVRSPQRDQLNLFIVFLMSVGLVLGGASPAFAKGNPLKKLNGQIIVSKKRFPSRFDSDAAMAKHMKKVNTHEIYANEHGNWGFEYMAFLPKPVAVLQAQVTFLDVTDSAAGVTVDSFTFYPNDRKDKVINGYQELDKSKFQANRKYRMLFARGYGQKPLASTVIVLR